MNKHDRAKLLNRFGELKLVEGISIKDSYIVFNWVSREVDRAIRAERRAQKLANEEANKWREEAEQRAIDAMSEKFGVKL